MKNRASKTVIIAHRGDSIRAPENTIAACNLALEQGADGLEVDLRLCGSGEIVLFHDKLLYRHFGSLKPVYLSTLKELRALQFSKNNYATKGNIASIDEFFEEFKSRTLINLEAKTFYADTGYLAREVVRAVKRFNMQDQVLISSFNPIFLKFVKLNTPALRTGYLFNKIPRIHRFIDIFLRSDAWHPHFSLIGDEFMATARKAGKEIYVWTVNEADTFKIMQNYGCEGIITDKFYKKRTPGSE
ncbi:MAG TPA: glycerophosphodiester phosphodiesterase [Calditrichaeota bacterium]|nr:glycerophosphodiester phosphodiesterase [Calditrichota bacterium]